MNPPEKSGSAAGRVKWRILRHPTDRGEGRGRFDAAAENASNVAGGGIFFSACLLIVLIWTVGLVVGLPAAVQDDLSGGMTALTLLLVALLKNSELRAERAMQLKLDAIANALLEDQGRGSGPDSRAALERAVRLHEEL